MRLQKKSEQFCHHILTLGTLCPKCLTSLVMSLSSHRNARSGVALSESPLYQHSYSSISQVASTLSVDKNSVQSIWKPIKATPFFNLKIVGVGLEHRPQRRKEQPFFCKNTEGVATTTNHPFWKTRAASPTMP